MAIEAAKVLLALAPVAISVLSARGLIHYFQLESYQFPGYFRTVMRNKVHSLLPGVCAFLAEVLLFFLWDKLALQSGSETFAVIGAALVLLFSACCGHLIAKVFMPVRVKKKLVFTGRLKRLYMVFSIVLCIISLLIVFSMPVTLAVTLLPLFLPLTLALGGLLAWPIEKLISELYFRDARRKLLSMKGLIRIGITGSYGKTSVKHILGTILSEKYATLITPASYNTPMGVTKAIRTMLTPSYQVFVGEMGARDVGDIREMCRLVKPEIGILTSVGPQHLETFKTIERIASTKYELIEALPSEGHCFFADDGGLCRSLYEKTAKPKVLASLTDSNADVWADCVSTTSEGSYFTLHVKGKGEVECQTRLLGEHSIQNIVLASAVASQLGLSPRQIAHGIQKLEPVKNRLELLKTPGSFTIINDAFNSNPRGAKAALKVLAQFPMRRIIITPGMVELGENEAEYNREFGRQIASSADIAIVIGKKRVEPILQGIREGGMDDSNVYRVDTLEDSTQLLHRIVRKEDTVLYENDLPDNYQEA